MQTVQSVALPAQWMTIAAQAMCALTAAAKQARPLSARLDATAQCQSYVKVSICVGQTVTVADTMWLLHQRVVCKASMLHSQPPVCVCAACGESGSECKADEDCCAGTQCKSSKCGSGEGTQSLHVQAHCLIRCSAHAWRLRPMDDGFRRVCCAQVLRHAVKAIRDPCRLWFEWPAVRSG